MANDAEPSYVIACAAVFLALCPILVALRFYTRTKQQVVLGLDDWLTLPALLMVIGCAITTIIGVKLGAFGYPTPTDDPTNYNFRINEQLEWAFFLMQILSMGFVKLSFVFFFRRIFCVGQNNRAFNIASAVVAVVAALWTVAFFLWFLFSCPNNFGGRWTSVKTYHVSCPTDGISDLGLAGSDIITDVMIFTLPIPMVVQLNTKLTRKLILLAVFVLGSMALVASCIRLAYFTYAIKVSEGEINDPTLDNNLLVTRGIYWSMLESGLALVCCCLPVLNAFVPLLNVQSAIGSARSMFTLSSRGSRTRRNVHEEDGQGIVDSDRNHSKATTDIGLDTVKAGLSGHDGRFPSEGLPVGGIHVQHTIEQRTSTAS